MLHQLSPHIRFKLGALPLLCLVPGNKGSRKKKAVRIDMDGVFEIYSDELEYLDTHGCLVYDAHRQERFVCRVRLLNLQSDSRGLQSMLHISGAPSLTPCMLCWHRGFKIASKGKVIYPGYGQDLPTRHPLRPVLENLNRSALTLTAPTAPAAVAMARGRTHTEIASAARHPVNGEAANARRYKREYTTA